MRKEIENWWKQTEYDFETAKDNFRIRRYSFAAFLCQQAVEKALKAAYIIRYKDVPKVHDLVFLAKKTELPQQFLEQCERIRRRF